MNFFHSLLKSKLDAMRAAAPRATLHMLHESNGFLVCLGEAAAARKVSQLGVITDHADDILDDSVLALHVPLEDAVRFVEEVTATHSVAMVDVMLADKVHAARYVMYGYFPKRQQLPPWVKGPVEADSDAEFIRYPTPSKAKYESPFMDFLAPVAGLPDKLAEKDPDADFWG